MLKKWIPVLLLVVLAGGIAAYVITGDQGDEKNQGKKTAKQGKKHRSEGDGAKVETGDVNVDATYQEKYEVSAAVTGEYGLDDDDVSDVKVSGNSAEVTLSNGTVVPVTLQDGEWVPSQPEGELPSAPQAETPQVDTPQQPQVQQPETPQQPQVQTPSAPG